MLSLVDLNWWKRRLPKQLPVQEDGRVGPDAKFNSSDFHDDALDAVVPGVDREDLLLRKSGRRVVHLDANLANGERFDADGRRADQFSVHEDLTWRNAFDGEAGEFRRRLVPLAVLCPLF